MATFVRAAPQLVVKITPEGGSERVIGFCTGLSYSVNNGTEVLFGIDSPFPQEISYGTSPIVVRGQMSLVALRYSTLEKSSLTPSIADMDIISNYLGGNAPIDQLLIAGGKYMHISVYDRDTDEMVWSCKWCKVNNYTMNIQARNTVRATISFTGKYLLAGNG